MQSTKTAKRVLAAMALAILVSPSTASAKAKVMLGPAEHIPAVVAAAYKADDGDTNLVLVSVAQKGAERDLFFKTFWRRESQSAGWRGMVTNYLQGRNTHGVRRGERRLPRFPASRGELAARRDPACKQCLAGHGVCVGADGKFTTNSYQREECRQLLGCAPCLHYLASGNKDYSILRPDFDMAVFTGAGEVKMAATFEEKSAIKNLLYLGSVDEICFSGRKSKDPANSGSICGKKVYLSGVVNLDQGHRHKPEIHPISSIAIEASSLKGSVQREKKYHLAAFIDETGGLWSNIGGRFDYQTKSDSYFPNNNQTRPRFHLRKLQGKKPKDRKAKNGKPGIKWLGVCELSKVGTYWVKSTSPAITSTAKDYANDDGLCPEYLEVQFHSRKDRRRKLIRDVYKGAGWGGKARVGWKGVNYNFRMSAKLHTPKGVVAKKPPGTKEPDSKAKRWYKFKLSIKQKFPQRDNFRDGISHRFDFEVKRDRYRRPINQVVLVEIPSKDPRKVVKDQWVWVGVNQDVQETFTDAYAPTLGVNLSYKGESIMQDQVVLRVPQPKAEVHVEKARATPEKRGPKYSAILRPKAKGFKGEKSKWTWAMNVRKTKLTAGGQASAIKGHSQKTKKPYKLVLRTGETASVDLVVADGRGIEKAVVQKLFQAPRVFVKAKTTLEKVSPSTQTYTVATGIPGLTLKPYPRKGKGKIRGQLAKSVRVVARMYQKKGKTFPVIKLKGPIKYKWTDLQYRAEGTDWKYEPISTEHYRRAKKGSHLIIELPERVGRYEFAAAVTATDGWKRKATAHTRGRNGHVPMDGPDIDRILEGVEVGIQRERGSKHFNSELEGLRRRARHLERGDRKSALRLTADIEALARDAFKTVAKKKKKRYRRREQPRFKTAKTPYRTRALWGQFRAARERLRTVHKVLPIQGIIHKVKGGDLGVKGLGGKLKGTLKGKGLAAPSSRSKAGKATSKKAKKAKGKKPKKAKGKKPKKAKGKKPKKAKGKKAKKAKGKKTK